ncbi:uncharacterized protein EV154DRAFT_94715 [Mucor mucedo]|uniref:uncharacterized protein n=1 Tax=Mucor mucedo TaxID=29922 RepID=UPI00221EBA61|nr:uncharacterized protein EV154DRAFT_94715 [Mucor mucedo]KAI7873385.1 hypothetical protein EV154DRAFT_94715 [Mucor mucedo]
MHEPLHSSSYMQLQLSKMIIHKKKSVGEVRFHVIEITYGWILVLFQMTILLGNIVIVPIMTFYFFKSSCLAVTKKTYLSHFPPLWLMASLLPLIPLVQLLLTPAGFFFASK